MKKVVVLILLICMCVVPIFAATLVKVGEVDDFGDPTGKSYLTFDQDLSGTFKNSSTSGSLKWNVRIDPESGKCIFILKERGEDVDVTTSSDSPYFLDDSAEYTVLLKAGDNSIRTLYGKLEKTDSYKTNGLVLYDYWSLVFGLGYLDCLDVFASGDSFKVVIKNEYGSYSLGVLDMSGFPALVYDDSLYNEGVRLMKEGKYQEALDVFAKYKATDAVSYAYFKTDEQVEKCKVALLDDSPYRKGVQLMKEGKYQKALDVFEEYKINDEASYVHFETDVQVDRCRKALGLYDVGDIGPSGGYVFYDCDADNDPNVNEGRGEDNLMSSECRWRYLEAAPSDLRIVDGVPTVDSSDSGYDGAKLRCIFGFARGRNLLVVTDTAIGTGKSNTEKLVKAMGDYAYIFSEGIGMTSDYAARLCSILEYEHDGVVYDDWFLPSKDELELMLHNSYVSMAFENYWSSSESSAYRAWRYFFGGGLRDDECRVRPVRAF